MGGITNVIRSTRSKTWPNRTTKTTTLVKKKVKSSSVINMLDAFVPRYRFGSSIYSTPVLFLLRLFYGASSFSNLRSADAGIASSARLTNPDLSTVLSWMKDQQDNCSSKLHSNQRTYKLSVRKWYDQIQSDPSQSSWRVMSVTWVKALASNLTHEYLQFVIVNPETKARQRLVADRNDDGDHIFVGHDWTSGFEAAACHDLPLPLLSLTFGHLPSMAQPSLSDLVSIIASVSSSQPEYDALKYMCWWFSETILGTALARHGGRLVEWQSANLRYSLVVRTGFLKRKVLTRRAEEFRLLNACSLIY